ncbi:MAG: arginine--tRNA ligase [Thermoplasmata archaeon]
MSSSVPSSGNASPYDPWAPILDDLLDRLAPALASRGAPGDRELLRQQLDLSGSSGWDVALALHRLAKPLGLPPAEVARGLAQELPHIPGLGLAEPVGAYLNYRADPEVLVPRTLALVFSRGGEYGNLPPRETSVCVEHTSANPVMKFHIGRVRNAIIGDTLARVLRADGWPVVTQYYVDDMGRQAAFITWIWSKPYAEWPPSVREQVPEPGPAESAREKPDHRLGRPYVPVSQYFKDHPQAAGELAELIHQLESGTPPPLHRRLAEQILSGMLESLSRLEIHFDEFVWESDFVHDGSVERIVERLRSGPHAHQEENGALAIDGGTLGLPKESSKIIVVRGDGTSLYPTRDVAYHLQKFARFPRVIDVLGQDHLLHAKVLGALLSEIGEPRRPEFVFYQYITLPGVGKMSSRGGQAVFLDDLLEEAVARARKEVMARREDLEASEMEEISQKVAAAAIRYHIVRIAPEKAVEFQWEDALSFEGRSGPFLQYSYARASSLLRKAERPTGPYTYAADQLVEPDELGLVKAISTLPRTVSYAARTAHVHTVATYAHELADRFNRFYQLIPVLKAERERESRIALVAAFRQTLGNSLGLLGLDRLERM